MIALVEPYNPEVLIVLIVGIPQIISVLIMRMFRFSFACRDRARARAREQNERYPYGGKYGRPGN